VIGACALQSPESCLAQKEAGVVGMGNKKVAKEIKVVVVISLDLHVQS
jgi:hypothetical protein